MEKYTHPTKNFTILKASGIENVKRLSTGCEIIDQILCGGLPNKGIIEVAGESGSGKTQLCMQLALTAQYPESEGGLGGGVAFICTEGHFPSQRLHELMEYFPKQYYKTQTQNIKFGNNIFIEHVFDFENLQQCLSKRIPILINRRGIRLVIIDSIAGIFRGSYTQADSYQRTKDLRTTGNILQHLCASFKVMILCVNQVSQVITTSKTVPALGLSWANMVTTRMQMHNGLGSNKKFEVIFSPELQPQIIDFSITKHGVTNL